MNYRIKQLNVGSAKSAETHCSPGRGFHVCLWIQSCLCPALPVAIFLRDYLSPIKCPSPLGWQQE